MSYIKIKFTLGLDVFAYQVIENGSLVEYRTESGELLELPNVTESYVVDDNPSTLEWMV